MTALPPNAASRRAVDNARIRFAHLAGPAYGNSVIHDEAAGQGMSRGGPPPRGPVVGVDAPRYPMNQGQPPFSVNGLSPNDSRWVRDRHVFVDQGNHSSTGRESGQIDPPSDGPIRPSLRMLVTNWRREMGTDATRNLDPKRAQYRPVGWQDGSPTRIFGGQPAYHQPYGARGGHGDLVPADTSGSASMKGTIPHGLHTHTVNPRRNTLKTYRSTPQMVPGRQDRLANSTRAGQSYSQTTVTQGARR